MCFKYYRSNLEQGVADVKLKKNLLDENRSLLGTKLSELNIKEKAFKVVWTFSHSLLLSQHNSILSDMLLIYIRRTTLNKLPKEMKRPIYFSPGFAVMGCKKRRWCNKDNPKIMLQDISKFDHCCSGLQ